jgi:hypothetical protein
MVRSGQHRRKSLPLPSTAARSGYPHHRRVQILGLLVLCGLATGATGAVIAVGSAELDIAPASWGTPDVAAPRIAGPLASRPGPARPQVTPQRAPVFRWPSDIARVPYPAERGGVLGPSERGGVLGPSERGGVLGPVERGGLLDPAQGGGVARVAPSPRVSTPGWVGTAGEKPVDGSDSDGTSAWREGAAAHSSYDAASARGESASHSGEKTRPESWRRAGYTALGRDHLTPARTRQPRASTPSRKAPSDARASAGSGHDTEATRAPLAAGSLTPVQPVTLGPPSVIGPVTLPPSGVSLAHVPPLGRRLGG